MSKNPHAVALGKLGGKVKSAAKTEAAQENGESGGRPRKYTPCPKHDSLSHWWKGSTCRLCGVQKQDARLS